jgi:hypothetical protein
MVVALTPAGMGTLETGKDETTRLGIIRVVVTVTNTYSEVLVDLPSSPT